MLQHESKTKKGLIYTWDVCTIWMIASCIYMYSFPFFPSALLDEWPAKFSKGKLSFNINYRKTNRDNALNEK